MKSSAGRITITLRRSAGSAFFPRHQFPPRQEGETSGHLRLDDFGDDIENRGDLQGRSVDSIQSFVDCRSEDLEEPAQAGIPPQGTEERLRVGEPVAELGQLAGLQEQEPIAAKEGEANGVVDAAEQGWPLAKLLRE